MYYVSFVSFTVNVANRGQVEGCFTYRNAVIIRVSLYSKDFTSCYHVFLFIHA